MLRKKETNGTKKIIFYIIRISDAGAPPRPDKKCTYLDQQHQISILLQFVIACPVLIYCVSRNEARLKESL